LKQKSLATITLKKIIFHWLMTSGTWGLTGDKLPVIGGRKGNEKKADTLKATEANRKRGTGTREKVRSKRINLDGNTHTQEINVSQLPV
jgi:hypothetical protein